LAINAAAGARQGAEALRTDLLAALLTARIAATIEARQSRVDVLEVGTDGDGEPGGELSLEDLWRQVGIVRARRVGEGLTCVMLTSFERRGLPEESRPLAQ